MFHPSKPQHGSAPPLDNSGNIKKWILNSTVFIINNMCQVLKHTKSTWIFNYPSSRASTFSHVPMQCGTIYRNHSPSGIIFRNMLSGSCVCMFSCSATAYDSLECFATHFSVFSQTRRKFSQNTYKANIKMLSGLRTLEKCENKSWSFILNF